MSTTFQNAGHAQSGASGLTSLSSGALAAATTGPILVAAKVGSGTAVSSVTDSQSNTYTLLGTSTAGSGAVVSLFICRAPATNLGTSDSVTINFASSSTAAIWVMCAPSLSGVAFTDDGVTGSANTTGTSVTLSGPTTTGLHDIVLSFGVSASGSSSLTCSAGTAISGPAGTQYLQGVETDAFAAGTYSDTWSGAVSNCAAIHYAINLPSATYKAQMITPSGWVPVSISTLF